jgi:molybdopterin adenylyltransferase
VNIKVGIITASDKGARGEREDLSGKLIREMVSGIGGTVEAWEIIPDETERISRRLIHLADNLRLDLILTTGGTGFSPRDVTPEATLAVIERQVPGIPEVMRRESLKKTPRAMLSRAVAGIRGQTLIVNLPGSPKAVGECLEAILPALPHGIEILRGEAHECGEQK